jgi:predicted amidohydrolase
MKISIAQTQSIKGDISANIVRHIKVVELASSLKAASIFFPELSLMGYEPMLAKDLATKQDDPRLDPFQKISDTRGITIGVGLPIKMGTGVQIGMVVFQPRAPRLTYAKQQLHADEFPYFEKGDQQLILNIHNRKVAPAICYESLQPAHSEKAVALGANVYLASVAKSANGVSKSMEHFPEVAKKYSIPVLMSNGVGQCDNFICAGQSAGWNKQGQLVAQLNDQQEGVILFDTETEMASKH